MRSLVTQVPAPMSVVTVPSSISKNPCTLKAHYGLSTIASKAPDIAYGRKVLCSTRSPNTGTPKEQRHGSGIQPFLFAYSFSPDVISLQLYTVKAVGV
jgi:hypothetical protein